ncbi:phosphoribosylformylglycinamidine synthase I [bacterium]|nr:phosphoribosylformylglycinamidine synthase I [candidate division CSSED10-310 bacterium]
MSIAVVQYPGTNCEFETSAAVAAAGMNAVVFRWNADPGELSGFDGYVLPGGFSYQDRVRAGAIAAKKRITETLIRQAEQGKPILGICNGAQILIETGMVPGIVWGEIQMALAKNNTGDRMGYHCDWVFIRSEPQDNPGCFNLNCRSGDIIPIPVAHAEGRFTTQSYKLLNDLTRHSQIGFKYCTVSGEIDPDFPVNPSGSVLNIAGLYNTEGNVMAFMPHPERASWMYQVPMDLPGIYGKHRMESHLNQSCFNTPGPGLTIFSSMKQFILNRRKS